MPRFPAIPDHAVTTTIRVRYFETDKMQVAHHAHYLVWFEEARSAFCRARGIDYSQMEQELGLFLPIVEARCRYLASARYDDVLSVSVFVLECARRTVRFGYVVKRDETIIAEGETYQILVDENGKPRIWPADIAALMTAGLSA